MPTKELTYQNVAELESWLKVLNKLDQAKDDMQFQALRQAHQTHTALQQWLDSDNTDLAVQRREVRRQCTELQQVLHWHKLVQPLVEHPDDLHDVNSVLRFLVMNTGEVIGNLWHLVRGKSIGDYFAQVPLKAVLRSLALYPKAQLTDLIKKILAQDNVLQGTPWLKNLLGELIIGPLQKQEKRRAYAELIAQHPSDAKEDMRKISSELDSIEQQLDAFAKERSIQLQQLTDARLEVPLDKSKVNEISKHLDDNEKAIKKLEESQKLAEQAQQKIVDQLKKIHSTFTQQCQQADKRIDEQYAGLMDEVFKLLPLLPDDLLAELAGNLLHEQREQLLQLRDGMARQDFSKEAPGLLLDLLGSNKHTLLKLVTWLQHEESGKKLLAAIVNKKGKLGQLIRAKMTEAGMEMDEVLGLLPLLPNDLLAKLVGNLLHEQREQLLRLVDGMARQGFSKEVPGLLLDLLRSNEQTLFNLVTWLQQEEGGKKLLAGIVSKEGKLGQLIRAKMTETRMDELQQQQQALLADNEKKQKQLVGMADQLTEQDSQDLDPQRLNLIHTQGANKKIIKQLQALDPKAEVEQNLLLAQEALSLLNRQLPKQMQASLQQKISQDRRHALDAQIAGLEAEMATLQKDQEDLIQQIQQAHTASATSPTPADPNAPWERHKALCRLTGQFETTQRKLTEAQQELAEVDSVFTPQIAQILAFTEATLASFPAEVLQGLWQLATQQGQQDLSQLLFDLTADPPNLNLAKLFALAEKLDSDTKSKFGRWLKDKPGLYQLLQQHQILVLAETWEIHSSRSALSAQQEQLKVDIALDEDLLQQLQQGHLNPQFNDRVEEQLEQKRQALGECQKALTEVETQVKQRYQYMAIHVPKLIAAIPDKLVAKLWLSLFKADHGAAIMGLLNITQPPTTDQPQDRKTAIESIDKWLGSEAYQQLGAVWQECLDQGIFTDVLNFMKEQLVPLVHLDDALTVMEAEVHNPQSQSTDPEKKTKGYLAKRQQGQESLHYFFNQVFEALAELGKKTSADLAKQDTEKMLAIAKPFLRAVMIANKTNQPVDKLLESVITGNQKIASILPKNPKFWEKLLAAFSDKGLPGYFSAIMAPDGNAADLAAIIGKLTNNDSLLEMIIQSDNKEQWEGLRNVICNFICNPTNHTIKRKKDRDGNVVPYVEDGSLSKDLYLTSQRLGRALDRLKGILNAGDDSNAQEHNARADDPNAKKRDDDQRRSVTPQERIAMVKQVLVNLHAQLAKQADIDKKSSKQYGDQYIVPGPMDNVDWIAVLQPLRPIIGLKEVRGLAWDVGAIGRKASYEGLKFSAKAPFMLPWVALKAVGQRLLPSMSKHSGKVKSGSVGSTLHSIGEALWQVLLTPVKLVTSLRDSLSSHRSSSVVSAAVLSPSTRSGPPILKAEASKVSTVDSKRTEIAECSSSDSGYQSEPDSSMSSAKMDMNGKKFCKTSIRVNAERASRQDLNNSIRKPPK